MVIKNICIYGVGGVGGYFGGKMALQINSTNMIDKKIYFIARGEHLNEIKINGLILNSGENKNLICKPFLATDNIDEIDTPDICFVCVKSYDLDNVVERLKSKITKNTLIVPLLNGVDIYDRIKRMLPDNIVLPACVYVGTHIVKPGTVTQNGGDGIIMFGKDPKRKDYIPEELISYLEEMEIKFNYIEDVFPSVWLKYIFVSAFGLVTAYSGKTIGEVLIDEDLKKYIKDIMYEVKNIAFKKGIKLPESIIEDTIAKANNFTFDTKTSYQRDIETKGKNNEGDLFGGTIIRLGKEVGVKTPVTEELYFKIKGT